MTRVHLLGMPNGSTTLDYSSCAFLSKTRKLATMLTAEGHEAVAVFLYGGL